MRYQVVKSVIDVLGYDQYSKIAFQSIELTDQQVEIIKEYMTTMDLRTAVKTFLRFDTCGFYTISDFRADIAIDDEDLITEWKYEKNKNQFIDLKYPEAFDEFE